MNYCCVKLGSLVAIAVQKICQKALLADSSKSKSSSKVKGDIPSAASQNRLENGGILRCMIWRCSQTKWFFDNFSFSSTDIQFSDDSSDSENELEAGERTLCTLRFHWATILLLNLFLSLSAGFHINNNSDEEPIYVAPEMSCLLKPHQKEGIRSMWKAVVRSIAESTSAKQIKGNPPHLTFVYGWNCRRNRCLCVNRTVGLCISALYGSWKNLTGSKNLFEWPMRETHMSCVCVVLLGCCIPTYSAALFKITIN